MKLGIKLLEMVKDIKIKHSDPPSPPLLKRLFMGEQTFLGKFMGWLFYMGSNNQIMQGGRKSSVIRIMEGFVLKVNGKEVSKAEPSLISILLTLTWSIDILFGK